jgi:hypothetical protein
MIYFLSGLPRSGSTVLSSILNQHPKIHSTCTSGLVDIMGAVCATWEKSPTTIAQGSDVEEAYRMLRSIIESKYKNITKEIVIDKSRSWVNPNIIKTMTNVLGTPPKIIATVRSTVDCAASFVRIVKPNNLDDFLYNSSVINHLKSSYILLQEGYKSYPENILFVEYDNLIQFPEQEMERIHKFLKIESFVYDYKNINTKIVAEDDDAAWGISGLHKISSELKYQHNNDSKTILGHHFDSFDQPNFWSKNIVSEKKKLDVSIDLMLEGKIKESYDVLCEAKKENQNCNKILYNLGWHLLEQNKLQEGMQHLAYGRFEHCFGNPNPNISTEIWDGKSKGMLLYYLEGDISSQIHYSKYIRDIKNRGCDLVVACSRELFPLIKSLGVDLIIEQSAVNSVYNDFWVPSMSVLIPLGYEFKDIDKTPHIKKTNKKHKKPIIVLSLTDNKRNYTDFFLAIKDLNIDVVTLEDSNINYPQFVSKIKLNNLFEMKQTIEDCDLLVSDCSAVAHLAGGMGIKTFVLVPILHDYLWCGTEDKSPYYQSMQLFRQKTFNCWNTPMHEMQVEMGKIFNNKKWSKIWQNMLEFKTTK